MATLNDDDTRDHESYWAEPAEDRFCDECPADYEPGFLHCPKCHEDTEIPAQEWIRHEGFGCCSGCGVSWRYVEEADDDGLHTLVMRGA